MKKLSSYKQIIKIALPMLLANLSIPLLGLVDTALLGHLDNAVYLGSVALGSQLIGMIFWAFGFLRMGTTGFTARALGADNQQEVYRRLQEAVGFGAVIGAAILVLQLWLLPIAMGLISTPGSAIFNLALEYASIRIWAAPAALITYALVGWLIGLQKTRTAMYILISTNVLNIILDYLFIAGMDMAVSGAAWASLISEYFGLFIGGSLVIHYLRQQGEFNHLVLKLNWNSIAEMFRSSRHLFVRTLCLLSTFLFFTSQGAHISDNIAAANAILLNLLALTAYAMDGFAYAAESLCGNAWGAQRRDDFVRACKQTTVLAALIAIGCVLVLLVGQTPILNLYTNIQSVQHAAQSGYVWLTFLPLIAIWGYQLDGIFIGMGRTNYMQNAMLFATFAIFLPVWWLSQELGNTGLWLAMTAFHLTRALSLGLPLHTLINKISEKS